MDQTTEQQLIAALSRSSPRTAHDQQGQHNQHDNSAHLAAIEAQPTPAKTANKTPSISRLPVELRYSILEPFLNPNLLAFQMHLAPGHTPYLNSAGDTRLRLSLPQFSAEITELRNLHVQKFLFGSGPRHERKHEIFAFKGTTLSMQRLPGPARCPNGLRKTRSITVKFSLSKLINGIKYPPDTDSDGLLTMRFVFDDSEVSDSSASSLSTFDFQPDLASYYGRDPLPDRGTIEAFDQAVELARKVNWKGSMQCHQMWYQTRRAFERAMVTVVQGWTSAGVGSSSGREEFLRKRFLGSQA